MTGNDLWGHDWLRFIHLKFHVWNVWTHAIFFLTHHHDHPLWSLCVLIFDNYWFWFLQQEWELRSAMTMQVLSVHDDDWWLLIDDWWLMIDDWWLMIDDWWLMIDDWWLMIDDWCSFIHALRASPIQQSRLETRTGRFLFPHCSQTWHAIAEEEYWHILNSYCPSWDMIKNLGIKWYY